MFCYVKKKESVGKNDRECAEHEDVRMFHSYEKGIYPLHDGCMICRENHCSEFGGMKYNDTFCICNSNQCNYDCRYSFSTDWGIEFNGSRYEHHRDVECWNKLESESGRCHTIQLYLFLLLYISYKKSCVCYFIFQVIKCLVNNDYKDEPLHITTCDSDKKYCG